MAKRIEWEEEEDFFSCPEVRVASSEHCDTDQDHEVPKNIDWAFDDGSIADKG